MNASFRQAGRVVPNPPEAGTGDAVRVFTGSAGILPAGRILSACL